MGYVKVPNAPKSPVGTIPTPQHRPAQGPPHVDSGARRNYYAPGAQQPRPPGGLPISLGKIGRVVHTLDQDHAAAASIDADKETRHIAEDVHRLAHPDEYGPTGPPPTPGTGLAPRGPVGVTSPMPRGPIGFTQRHKEPSTGPTIREHAPALNSGPRPQAPPTPGPAGPGLGQSGERHITPRLSAGPPGPIAQGPVQQHGARAHGPTRVAGSIGDTSSTGDATTRLGGSTTFDKSKAIETTGREVTTGDPRAAAYTSAASMYIKQRPTAAPAAPKAPSKPKAPRAKKV